MKNTCPSSGGRWNRCKVAQLIVLLLLLVTVLVTSLTNCSLIYPPPAPSSSPPTASTQPAPPTLSLPPLPSPAPTAGAPPSPAATELAIIYNAQSQLEINKPACGSMSWQVEAATLTRDLPSSYSASKTPRGVYLVLDLATTSLSWDAAPPTYKQLVLIDNQHQVYDPVASHGLFLTLLDPQRIRTLIDPSAGPYRSSVVFDVSAGASAFLLGIKREAHDLQPAGYLLLPPIGSWP